MNIVLDVIVGVIFVISMMYMLPRLSMLLKEELKNNRTGDGNNKYLREGKK
jgi:hypothetical protein